jgi:hypothetical protein
VLVPPDLLPAVPLVPLEPEEFAVPAAFVPAASGTLAEFPAPPCALLAAAIEDTAASFDQARADFEAAWQKSLPRFTPDDFDGYRRQRAWTAWKYDA